MLIRFIVTLSIPLFLSDSRDTAVFIYKIADILKNDYKRVILNTSFWL